MALVHLVAHSLYKAHAFLGAGGTVRQTQRKQLAPAPGAPTVKAIALGAVLAIAGAFATGWAWALLPFTHTPSATVWVMGGIVALAVVPLTTRVAGRHGSRLSTPLLGAVTVPLAYFAVHSLAERLVPHAGSAPAGLLAFVAASFAALFVVQVHCMIAPGAPLERRLYPWIYGGLFLDEAFTRVAFAIWPPRMPSARTAVLPRPSARPTVAAPARDIAPPAPTTAPAPISCPR
jgi:NAD(P)H-quinone oxidoreductase subunit 5